MSKHVWHARGHAHTQAHMSVCKKLLMMSSRRGIAAQSSQERLSPSCCIKAFIQSSNVTFLRTIRDQTTKLIETIHPCRDHLGADSRC